MAISVVHAKVLSIPDGADTTIARPSDWNANHTLTMSTARLIGRTTASVGAAEEISVGSGLTLSAGSLVANFSGSYNDLTDKPGNATTSVDGFMSAADKTKLNGVATGATANTGTVTSVALTVPTGFTIGGSPVTTSGTLAVAYDTGYQGYTTTEATKLSGIIEGTTAEYLANTVDRYLVTDQVNASGAIFALTDGATISWDMANGFNASVTLAGNRTLANPTNPIIGRAGAIIVTQDATGSRTLSYGTSWEAAEGTFPELSTAANSKDVLFYWIQSSTSIIITGILKGVA